MVLSSIDHPSGAALVDAMVLSSIDQASGSGRGISRGKATRVPSGREGTGLGKAATSSASADATWAVIASLGLIGACLKGGAAFEAGLKHKLVDHGLLGAGLTFADGGFGNGKPWLVSGQIFGGGGRAAAVCASLAARKEASSESSADILES
jgi:hypothetical protein